jgi:SAM-dependent methyltransferase
MNPAHMELCASPAWREIVEQLIMPDALRNADLGSDVIEVGPGPGFTTDYLRALTDHLTAVELDRGLADSLKRRLMESNVEVVLGDAAALGVADSRFTGAASFHMLHHIPTGGDQNRVFAELLRVLKAGGMLVAADGVPSDASRAFHDGDTYNPIDPEDLDQRLRAVGFVSVNVQLHDLGWFCTASRPGS